MSLYTASLRELIAKHNPYHDERGRFSTGSRARSTSAWAAHGGVKKYREMTSTPEGRAKMVEASLDKLRKNGVEVTIRGSGGAKWETQPDGTVELSYGGVPEGKYVAAAWDRITKGSGVTPEDFVKGLTGNLDTSGTRRLTIDGATNSVVFAGRGTIVHGAKALSFQRTYDLKTGDMHHDYLKYAEGERGAGGARAMMKNGLKLYEKMGVKQVSVHAALEDGPFVWSKAGFSASALTSKKMVMEMQSEMLSFGRKMQTQSAYQMLPPDQKVATIKEFVRVSRRMTALEKMAGDPAQAHRVNNLLARTKTPLMEKVYASINPPTGDGYGYRQSKSASSSGIIRAVMVRHDFEGKIDLGPNSSQKRVAMRWAGLKPPKIKR